ncbi:MAG: hypothetical protein GXO79_02185 [Chlorobi bacterium]|nr:hypothetical protein [Chlorobiota bacterium]
MRNIILLILFTIADNLYCQNEIMLKNGTKIDNIDSVEINKGFVKYFKSGIKRTVNQTDFNFLFVKNEKGKKYRNVYAVYNSKLNFLFEMKIKNSNLSKLVLLDVISSLSKTLTKEFRNGFIVTFKNDTIRSTILNNQKNDILNYLVVIAKIDSNKIKLFFPKDIKAYNNGFDNFISINKFDNGPDCFIKEEERGEINLYSRTTLPHDRTFLYFIRYGSNKKMHIVNPELSTVRIDFGNYITVSYEKYFKAIMYAYMNDCPEIISKVNNKFYNAYELNVIVHEYNNCK